MLQSVTIADEGEGAGLRGSAVVTPRLRVAGVPVLDNLAASVAVTVTVKVNMETVVTETLPLTTELFSPSSKYMVLELSAILLPDVALWFPRGYGEPNLYIVDIEYCPASSAFASLDVGCQTLSKRIGFRTVELVQEPIEVVEEVRVKGQTESVAFAARSQPTTTQTQTHPSLTLMNPPPASFYLRVNNLSVFAKGANFIPIDVFSSRVTAKDRLYVLESAAATHMNMVRVWGGGRYQETDFYERADEMGMMVWEEVMLACALYPRDDAFLANVFTEVEDQLWRLSSHPSIVVLGGNNENEVALGWFSESNNNRDLYVSDYR